jgi:hypothetical protein
MGFLDPLSLATRLRHFGVPLPNISGHVIHDFVVATNPHRIEKPDNVREVLQAAW